jgi:hypothetical protein
MATRTRLAGVEEGKGKGGKGDGNGNEGGGGNEECKGSKAMAMGTRVVGKQRQQQ